MPAMLTAVLYFLYILQHPEVENTFEDPSAVAPSSAILKGTSNSFVVEVGPYSVSVLGVKLEKPPTPSVAVY